MSIRISIQRRTVNNPLLIQPSYETEVENTNTKKKKKWNVNLLKNSQFDILTHLYLHNETRNFYYVVPCSLVHSTKKRVEGNLPRIKLLHPETFTFFKYITKIQNG